MDACRGVWSVLVGGCVYMSRACGVHRALFAVPVSGQATRASCTAATGSQQHAANLGWSVRSSELGAARAGGATSRQKPTKRTRNNALDTTCPCAAHSAYAPPAVRGRCGRPYPCAPPDGGTGAVSSPTADLLERALLRGGSRSATWERRTREGAGGREREGTERQGSAAALNRRIRM